MNTGTTSQEEHLATEYQEQNLQVREALRSIHTYARIYGETVPSFSEEQIFGLERFMLETDYLHVSLTGSSHLKTEDTKAHLMQLFHFDTSWRLSYKKGNAVSPIDTILNSIQIVSQKLPQLDLYKDGMIHIPASNTAHSSHPESLSTLDSLRLEFLSQVISNEELPEDDGEYAMSAAVSLVRGGFAICSDTLKQNQRLTPAVTIDLDQPEHFTSIDPRGTVARFIDWQLDHLDTPDTVVPLMYDENAFIPGAEGIYVIGQVSTDTRSVAVTKIIVAHSAVLKLVRHLKEDNVYSLPYTNDIDLKGSDIISRRADTTKEISGFPPEVKNLLRKNIIEKYRI